MKKVFLLSLFAIMMIVAGCSSDNEPKSDFDMNLLYGRWRITHVESKGVMVDVTTPSGEAAFKPTYATFKKDGTYYGSGFFGNGSGTYKVKGKTIICYVEGVEYFRYDVISIQGTTCELKMYRTGSLSSIKIRCKKQ